MGIDVMENSRLSFDVTNKKSNLIRALIGEETSEGEIDLDLIDSLESFEHPFEKSLMYGIEELAESIKTSGLWQPIIVRPKVGGRYELLAGHRRTAASRLAGMKNIKAIINDCDDDTAKLIVTETNTYQREEIFPSERAKAYKMQLESLKSQGKRNDLVQEVQEKNNLWQSLPQVKSRELVAELNSVKARTVSTYLRLNELISTLLDRVDIKEIPINAAVELSYLKVSEQEALEQVLVKDEKIRVTIALAEQLKSISQKEELTEDIINAWINPKFDKKDKLIQTSKPTYKKAFKRVESYIKNFDSDKTEKLALVDENVLESKIIAAIEDYLGSL